MNYGHLYVQWMDALQGFHDKTLTLHEVLRRSEMLFCYHPVAATAASFVLRQNQNLTKREKEAAWNRLSDKNKGVFVKEAVSVEVLSQLFESHGEHIVNLTLDAENGAADGYVASQSSSFVGVQISSSTASIRSAFTTSFSLFSEAQHAYCARVYSGVSCDRGAKLLLLLLFPNLLQMQLLLCVVTFRTHLKL